MDEKEKLVDFYYDRLQSIRRAQKHYLALLLTLLGFVWVFYWGKSGASPASVFGLPISNKSLLGITPGLSTILLLGVVGSLRAAQPALQLFREAWKNSGAATELKPEGINNHQNWVDYLGFIWARPFGYLIHAGVLLAAMASTFAIGVILAPKFKGYSAFLFTAYCLLCLGVQAAATWKWIAERVTISRRKD